MATLISRKTKVPSSRMGRFVRLGFAAGELALGGITEGVRNFGKSPGTATNLVLSAGNAKKLAGRLAGMRGAAMKMGQILSMEGTDFLPREFADALAVLRNGANTMPDSQLRRVLGREYGKGWEARFEHFDYEPLAAASIGQVHRAVTRDGRELALKIQYPGVSKSIDSDIDNMAMLIRMSRMLPADLDITTFTKEAKAQLRREADYRLEAKNLADYRQLVAGDDRFIVPKVHDDFSTGRILAMDYVEGVPLESLGEEGVSQEERNDVGKAMQRLIFRELFEFRTMQSDPNFANYLYQPQSRRIVLLDFGSTVTFEKIFTDHYAGIAEALIEDDQQASRHFAQRLGYISEQGSEGYNRQIMQAIRMVCEPIHTTGIYDFGSSDLFSRARDFGMEMFLSGNKQEYVVPPPETAFLHRKLMGSYLLCSRIQARINVQKLIRPYLPAAIAG